MRMIFCSKLKKDAEGLDRSPLPGKKGEQIYEHISKEAWALWVNHQTMLINEYRLSLINPQSRAFLIAEMDKFLFGTGSEKPPGFTDITE